MQVRLYAVSAGYPHPDSAIDPDPFAGVTLDLCWFPASAVARGSKGNTVRRTQKGPNPWLPPQL